MVALSRDALKEQEVIVFMSSRNDEYSSEELSFTGAGYFTGPLLDGLKGAADANNDRLITARELFNYVHWQVVIRTNGMQHPVMFGKFNPNKVLIDLR